MLLHPDSVFEGRVDLDAIGERDSEGDDDEHEVIDGEAAALRLTEGDTDEDRDPRMDDDSFRDDEVVEDKSPDREGDTEFDPLIEDNGDFDGVVEWLALLLPMIPDRVARGVVDAVTVAVATTEGEIESRLDIVIVWSVDDVRLVAWVRDIDGDGDVEGLERAERELDGETETLCVTRDTVELAVCVIVAIEDVLKSPVADISELPLESIE
jgi:hypothetical protein